MPTNPTPLQTTTPESPIRDPETPVPATREPTTFARQIDAFEIELSYTEAFIDLLYQLPQGHEYERKLLEDLHTHRLRMRQTYDVMRRTLLATAI